MSEKKRCYITIKTQVFAHNKEQLKLRAARLAEVIDKIDGFSNSAVVEIGEHFNGVIYTGDIYIDDNKIILAG